MITTAFQPSSLSVDRLLALSEATFDRVILITGVPAREDGEPMWASLDEAAVAGHPHGLLAAIDAIVHVHKWVSMVNSIRKPAPIETLTLRWSTTIEDGFDGDAATLNPFGWIHLGHGCVVHNFELVEDDLDYGGEEYIAIPGISNGNEDENYLSCSEVTANQAANRDHWIHGPSVVLCQPDWSISAESGRIHLAHAPVDFRVNDSNQFYDAAHGATLRPYRLNGWTEWVATAESTWRDWAVNRYKGEHMKQTKAEKERSNAKRTRKTSQARRGIPMSKGQPEDIQVLLDALGSKDARRILDALLVLHEFVGLEDGVELDEVMYFWNNDAHLETGKLELFVKPLGELMQCDLDGERDLVYEIRMHACDLLSLTNKDAVPYLLLGVDGPHASVDTLKSALIGLVRFEATYAGDAIYTSIFDEDFESFYGDDILAAVEGGYDQLVALGKLGDDRAFDLLVKALAHEDWGDMAAEVLAEIDTERSMEVLG